MIPGCHPLLDLEGRGVVSLHAHVHCFAKAMIILSVKFLEPNVVPKPREEICFRFWKLVCFILFFRFWRLV